jgi:GntR family transcriptional regulator
MAPLAPRRVQASRKEAPPDGPRLRALLVECNAEELSRYRDELESELPLSVDRILADDLPGRLAREPDLFSGYSVVVTTFFHIHEVKRVMPPDGPPAVALLSEGNIPALLRLTEFPEGTTVGLVCTTPTGSQNLLRSVQSAGLSHLTPVLASTDDPWSISRMLEQTRTVVCSEHGAARIRGWLPPDVEVILSHRTLDRGGLEMLRDMLAHLPSAGAQKWPPHSPPSAGAQTWPPHSPRAAD